MKRKIVCTILLFVILPIILFEYLVLVWFWGGAGIFNFFATPLTLGVYLILLFRLKKQLKIVESLNTVTNILFVVIAPLLTIVTVWLISHLFGIDIVIL